MAALEPSLEVHLLDVGQGEAIILDLPDGSFALLDGGPTVAADRVLPEIESRRKAGKRFCLAGITQWDSDHIAGIPEILRHFEPDVFYIPGVDLQLLEQIAGGGIADDQVASRSLQVRTAIEKLPPSKHGKFCAPNRLEELRGVEAHVLGPMSSVDAEIRKRLERKVLQPSEIISPARLKKFRNRASVAIWLTFGGRVLFLTGETDGDQYRSMEEFFLCGRGGLRPHVKSHAADWIKLSHHGGDENNPSELFQLFARESFVASASSGGGYNHPHPATLKRAHFDHGGVVLCTNLGKGCYRLTHEKKLNAKTPEFWTDDLLERPSPSAPCYQTISVRVTHDGKCSVRSQSIQKRCPYGGPKSGEHAW